MGSPFFPITFKLISNIIRPKYPRIPAWGRALHPERLGQRWLLLTHHLPGVADIVGLLPGFSQLVYVPGQGWVHRHCDNLAAQREAALASRMKYFQAQDKIKHLIKGWEEAVSQWSPPDFEKQWSTSLLKEMWDFRFYKSIMSVLH